MSEIHSHSAEKRRKSTRTRKRLQKKIQNQKENGFVLDCLNQSKSQLRSYKSINDKFLNYFVIRVHPNVSKHAKHRNPLNKVSKVEHIENVNHNRFQEMLRRQREKVMSPRTHHSKPQSLCDNLEVNSVAKEQQENEKIMNEINQSIKFKEHQQTIKEQVQQEEQLDVAEA